MATPEGWEVREVQRGPAYQLVMPDGRMVVTQDGLPFDYESREQAEHVAANWDNYRAPTWAELQSIPDDDLMRGASGL